MNKYIKYAIVIVLVMFVLVIGIRDTSVPDLMEEYPKLTEAQAESIVEDCPSKFAPTMDQTKEIRFCREEKAIEALKNEM